MLTHFQETNTIHKEILHIPCRIVVLFSAWGLLEHESGHSDFFVRTREDTNTRPKEHVVFFTIATPVAVAVREGG